ncbi:hypothetical protein [Flavobacterium sp.]|uniref:hypothetical protein n=1 Tax=Flavobacterium sp. TaxID=239 RepID=UPI0026057C73|nr:hypothetical protein [Flavobacterium sp.]MDD3004185.1 hypothetical protein [Flavobacterium sp.]
MKPLKINIVLFGIGSLGSAIINQIIEKQQALLEEKNIEIRFPVITNSTLAFFENEYKKNKWDADFTKASGKFTVQNIIDYVQEEELENLVVIDATKSLELLNLYPLLVQKGFNLITFNEQVQLQESFLYSKLKKDLKEQDKRYVNARTKSKITTKILLEYIFKAVDPWVLNQRRAS